MAKQSGSNGGTAVAPASQPSVSGVEVDLLRQAEEFQQATHQRQQQLVRSLREKLQQVQKSQREIESALAALGGLPVERVSKASNGTAPKAPTTPKTGRRKGVNKTAMVFELVQTHAKGKRQALKSGELLALAQQHKDERFHVLGPVDFSTSLQALRRARPQKVALIPGPEGKPRGGKYYAVV